MSFGQYSVARHSAVYQSRCAARRCVVDEARELLALSDLMYFAVSGPDGRRQFPSHGSENAKTGADKNVSYRKQIARQVSGNFFMGQPRPCDLITYITFVLEEFRRAMCSR